MSGGGQQCFGFRGVIRQALKLRVKAGNAFGQNILRHIALAGKDDLDNFLLIDGIRQRLPDTNIGKRRERFLVQADVVGGRPREQLDLVFER